ncbi:MAG: flagellar M-ring protein FliF [Gammaproteobacteria bacterium]|nr:flagellar M-ring protein FliF [Gammaproteobacteria bacterium]
MEAAEGSPLTALNRIPGLRQLVLLTGLALAIAAGVTAAFYVREPGYAMLFSNVSQQEAGEIMNALNATDIPHRIDPKSGAILVAGERVAEARLKLAGQGLPRGASFGLEIMQEQGSFGTSQFMENARYNHALETELARTISTLRPVQAARVHLALPENSVFLRKRREPSASVLLNLYPGRELEKTQVAAIVHLVASSIPGMEAGKVTVVDQQGKLLSAPGDASALGLSTQQFEFTERLENSYTERIVSLLGPMLGPGRIRATVTADMDYTEREETREAYDPDNTALRSEQVAEERRNDAGPANGGIPGALSNTPPPPVVATNAANPPPAGQPAQATAAARGAPAAQGTAPAPTNESLHRTRNFEVDRTLSRTRSSIGSIRRLSVAVLVDHKRTTAEDGTVSTQAPTQQEIDEITRLVKEAVGFDEKRGDTVSVSSVSFYEQPAGAAGEGPGLLDSPGLFDTVRTVLAGLLVLALAFAVIRPIMRGLGSTGGAPPAGALPAGAGAGGPAGQPRAALSFDDKVSVARQLADKNPERVAQIVRTWMQTDE